MIARILLDTAQVPGGGTLSLFRRGDAYMITLRNNELMNSRVSGSEEALAALACDRIAARPAPALLIGGLGMGFTLRKALALLGGDAVVTVAELVPEVIDWARGPLAGVFGGCLDDPRVAIVADDVGRLIRAARGAFDAILLDVDNGPEGLVRAANDGLYSRAGLTAARAALRPRGVLAIWSATPSAAFAARLRETGFAVEEHAVRANGQSGARHTVWIAG